MDVEAVNARTAIDPWFLRELEALATSGDGTEGLERTYKSVDTCAAEFEARNAATTTRGTSAPPRPSRGR